MKNIKLLFHSIILLISLNSFGQTKQGIIQGHVYNQENEPAMFSTIVLMNKDSVFMNGNLSGEDGFFKIDKIGKGEYHIMVRNIEFNTYISELISISENEVFELGSIHLEAKLNEMEEVVIKGEKAMVEIHPDKMVYNISASVNATGNNALELLAKSPGVSVDFDNNITLQGKNGVQIYINGQPSRISGSDLTNMLEGLRSEDIESIEIITNPSSKYDAEGTGGIINIVMKKDLNIGFNGSITGNYSKGIKPRNNVGTNLSYNGKKLNVFSSLSYSDDNYTFNRNELMVREDYSLNMVSLSPTNRKGINFSGGIDYKISNEQTLSLDTRISVNRKITPQSSSTLIEDLNEVLSAERLLAETSDNDNNDNYNANLHYGFVPNRSSEFTADISFGYYSKRKNTKQPNEYFSIDSMLLRTVESKYNEGTGIDLVSAQMDYKKSIGKASFSTGVKYSYINTDNKLDFFDVDNNVPFLNTDRTNDFTYLEKVAAAYGIFNWNPFEKVSMMAGLRVENTSSLGELISANPGPDDVVPRNYTSLFPNFSISYDDKEQHALSLSLGRRITRPNYQNLNPFESKMNELAAWKGNPFLEPNFITNYQITYAFKRKLVISNTYSITYNYFANIFEKVGDKGSVIIPRNMEKAIVNGLSVSYPLSISKWWEFSTYLQYNYEAYTGDIQGTLIDLEAHIVNFRMQNNLSLPGEIRMELSYYVSSPFVWRGTVNVDEFYSIDLGVKREFLKKKVLLQVSVRDIFNTGSKYYYSSNYGGMVVDGDVFFDGRRLSLSASYKFGNQAVKARKSKSSLDKELKRISD